jgi:ABC-2 type transport system ATP-binding protein
MEEPDLLILDEPFNGLDEEGVELVRNILLEMRKQGISIVLSSHNSEDIDLLCDTVHRLQKGIIIE